MDLETLGYRTEWARYANERAFAAPADPRKLVDVDPDAVEWYTNALRLNWGLGRVQGGTWDLRENCQPLSETTTQRALVQHFEAGADWEETVLYERAEAAFADGESFRGYDSLTAFRKQRLAYLDDLFERIDTEGYRSNRDAGHENPLAADHPFENAYVHYLEPLIAVGRDGAIIWCEGYHRLTMAAILDIETIPVQVLCRHERWQRTRDRVYESGGQVPERLEGHPDLADLRSG